MEGSREEKHPQEGLQERVQNFFVTLFGLLVMLGGLFFLPGEGCRIFPFTASTGG